jgi:hypothetical protein
LSQSNCSWFTIEDIETAVPHSTPGTTRPPIPRRYDGREAAFSQRGLRSHGVTFPRDKPIECPTLRPLWTDAHHTNIEHGYMSAIRKTAAVCEEAAACTRREETARQIARDRVRAAIAARR